METYFSSLLLDCNKNLTHLTEGEAIRLHLAIGLVHLASSQKYPLSILSMQIPLGLRVGNVSVLWN